MKEREEVDRQTTEEGEGRRERGREGGRKEKMAEVREYQGSYRAHEGKEVGSRKANEGGGREKERERERGRERDRGQES